MDAAGGRLAGLSFKPQRRTLSLFAYRMRSKVLPHVERMAHNELVSAVEKQECLSKHRSGDPLEADSTSSGEFPAGVRSSEAPRATNQPLQSRAGLLPGLPRGVQHSVAGPLPVPSAVDEVTADVRSEQSRHPAFSESPDETVTVTDASSHGHVASTSAQQVKKFGFEPPRRLDAHRAEWISASTANDRSDGLLEPVTELAPEPIEEHHEPAVEGFAGAESTEEAFNALLPTDSPRSESTRKSQIPGIRRAKSTHIAAWGLLAVGALAVGAWSLWPSTPLDSAHRTRSDEVPLRIPSAANDTDPTAPAAAFDTAPSEQQVAADETAQGRSPEKATEPGVVSEPAAASQATEDVVERGRGEPTAFGAIPQLVKVGVDPKHRRIRFIRRRQLAGVHLRRGVRMQRRGQHEAAMAQFRSAIDYYPLQGASMRHLARYAIEDENLELAANWAFEAAKADPRHPLSWLLLGEIQQMRNELVGARASYQKVLTIARGHRGARRKLRRLERELKKRPQRR